MSDSFIDENEVRELIERGKNLPGSQIQEIIHKAERLQGLSLEETAALLECQDETPVREICQTAKKVKEAIYGTRLVLFAPLYLSNHCTNNCLYCGFRRGNRDLKRKRLTLEEIRQETEALLAEGHKRLLLVAAEDPHADINYLEGAIRTIYQTRTPKGSIRRVNINVAPLTLDGFRRLKKAGIGTYQLFQETYHLSTYRRLHPSGPKSDFSKRLLAPDLAMSAGIDDVGIGVLFGLSDYRFEVLALLKHVRHLEENFGVGPHTISVPRVEPAFHAPISLHPPHPVSDEEFKTIVAVLRLAVPYTGLILSTRESAVLRNELFHLGISQISAGSRTNPGGYTQGPAREEGQFSVADQRNLNEVVRSLLSQGFLPSFCTSCYRVGRTGEKFMDLAKPGEIQKFCLPNALLTLREYLLDYGKDGEIGEGIALIDEELEKIRDRKIKEVVIRKLNELEEGKRDLYF